MTRRRAVLGLVTALAAGAGCSGPQNRRLTGRGTPATLDAETRAATGLSLARSVDAPLQTRVETTLRGDVSVQAVVEVDVTTPVREYRRSGLAVGVVSTPAAQPVEGRDVYRDPLAERSPAEQVGHAQARYAVSGLGEGRETGRTTLLGTETVPVRYVGRSDAGDAQVSLARARDGEEFVTVAAVAVEGTVDLSRVLAGVEHEA